MDEHVAEAYRRCRRMQRRHDPTYYCGDALPAARAGRPAVHALYGFVRGADEIADGPRRAATPSAPRARSTPGRPSSTRACEGGSSSHPVIAALVDAGRAPRAAAPADAAATWTRCAPTARPVRMRPRRSSSATWTARRPSGGSSRRCSARPSGADAELARLGARFQLTNLIRDVGEDWAMGRSTCPA